jgi:hypothetical protein
MYRDQLLLGVKVNNLFILVYYYDAYTLDRTFNIFLLCYLGLARKLIKPDITSNGTNLLENSTFESQLASLVDPVFDNKESLLSKGKVL